jgi:hypothetical protein
MGLVVALLCCASASAQQTQRGQPGSLREIIPGHYMFSSGDLNSGIIASSDRRYDPTARSFPGVFALP